MKKFYEAVSGGTDGRDCKSLGYFETRKLAEHAAKGQGTMGYGDGSVVELEMYTMEDLTREIEQEAMMKAINAKLTKEEQDLIKKKISSK